MNIRLKTAGLVALATTLPVLADVKVNDNFSVSGYAAAAYEYQKVKSLPSTDSFFDGTKDTASADALKLQGTATFKPVSIVASLYYVPKIAHNDLSLLDAYATVDVGSGASFTAGKFLSYLGYEAFDTANMNQVTYGAVTIGTLGAIPAYHSGLRFDYGDKDVSFGVAALDSVFSPSGFSRGDGEIKKNMGWEAFVKYTAITNLTLWGGLAYDSKGGFQAHAVEVLDLWAEYKLTKEATVAAEFCTKDGGELSKGWTWLTYLNYAINDQFSTVFRVSGEQLSSKTKLVGNDFVQYTVGPSYKINDNFTVRAEYSYYDYSGTGRDKSLWAVQGLFKF